MRFDNYRMIPNGPVRWAPPRAAPSWSDSPWTAWSPAPWKRTTACWRVCQHESMNRDEVIRALKDHERELRAAGVIGVSLFGSTARGESDPGDVDIAVRLAESFSQGGFDYFGRLEDLEQYLSQLLGCTVDVVEDPVPKERFQKEIDKDRAL